MFRLELKGLDLKIISLCRALFFMHLGNLAYDLLNLEEIRMVIPIFDQRKSAKDLSIFSFFCFFSF